MKANLIAVLELISRWSLIRFPKIVGMQFFNEQLKGTGFFWKLYVFAIFLRVK